MESIGPTEVARRQDRSNIEFDRRLVGLNRIVFRGALLSMVTFGVYRFWYLTELRRFFWSRTVIVGSPAEYTGRGKELFLGFLVALAVVVPIYIAVSIAALSVPAIAPYSGLLLFVVLFPLGQYASYRARRYRASRSLWRGIRLRQDGSGLAYTGRSVGWAIASIASLGLAYPFMRASLERYRIDHTLVGESRMASSASGRSVLTPWLLVYVFAVAPVIVAGIAFAVAADFSIPHDLFLAGRGGKREFNPVYADATFVKVGLIFLLTTAICSILFLCLFPVYWANETRAFIASTTLGAARLESSLRKRDFYKPYLIYAAALMAFTILVFALTFAAMRMMKAVAGADPFHLSTVAFLFGAYLLGAFLLNLLYVRIIQVRLWRAVAESTTVRNIDALERILSSRHTAASGLNEGLGDALGVGGALEIGL
ncbi:DUF898 domain-containing protein [Methylobacterium sp. BTF04]|uniref:DUF898 family protein n=1 Tax=Methylobacterium sp. BTF04 TaxID=2708300 RepID=UPI0013D7A0C1|nr:DUF898 family protein [Methylobacterium sp. BTF04]NEU13800.1 DUF898 domain-containing protein [Methylobacterium sp. BTF04]